MRTCLCVALSLFLAVSVVFSGERKDPFDEYIYHAPQLTGIVCDGNPSDWPELLPWEPLDFKKAKGNMDWPTQTGGWNYPPDGPEDFSVQFRAGWRMIEDWPVLYLLVEWIDDEFHFDPQGSWNTTDALQFWYGETLYDYDSALPHSEDWGWYGRNEDYAIRGMEVRLAEDWGIRMYRLSEQAYVVDENQSHTKVADQRISNTQAYIECQVQMFQDYRTGTPWQMEPGVSYLAFAFRGACDYDPGDGSFTFLTWYHSFSWSWDEDIRAAFSTIAFERENYYTTVKSSSWGAIKNSF